MSKKKRLLAGMIATLMILSQSTLSFGFEKYDKKETKKHFDTVHRTSPNNRLIASAETVDGKTFDTATVFQGSSTTAKFNNHPFIVYKYTPETTGDYEIKSSNPGPADSEDTDPKIFLLNGTGVITRIMDEAYSPTEESYDDLNFDIIVPCTANSPIYFAVTTYDYFDNDDDDYLGESIDDLFDSEDTWDVNAFYTVTISKSTNHIHGIDYHGEKTTVQEVNCGQDGIYTYLCCICGRNITETVPATGEHEWDSGIVTTDPTETGNGVRTLTCTVCGSKGTESIPATGIHTWDGGVVTVQPTEKNAGVKTYTCSGCGMTRTESIPATGVHSWNGGKVTVRPTEDAAGVKTYICSGCGKRRTESIPAIIIPKTVSKTVKSLKAKAKKTKVTISWKKLSKKDLKKLKNVTGIDVQVATDSAFTKKIVNKTIGKKKAKLSFNGKKKTTYWVRVRYHASDGVSAWKNKSVKVK